MGAPKGNKYALGNPGGGREAIYPDNKLKEYEKRITEYFEWIQGEKEEQEIEVKKGRRKVMQKVEVTIREAEPPTVNGLTLFLGFCNKSTLYDYDKKKVFSQPTKRALALIEQWHEMRAAYGDKCTGNIFILKNMGWTDQIDLTSAGEAIKSMQPVVLGAPPKDLKKPK